MLVTGQQLLVKRQNCVVISAHLCSAVFPALRCVACVSMCAGPVIASLSCSSE
jgi:hypothetical protein